jgi:acyl-coenzyme A thioesterase PaaI-like protein
MQRDEKIPIEKVDGHTCFACGTANPIGLQMNFYRQGENICSDITLGEFHVGWENIAHGGIISTMLDEVMSWTVLYFKRSFFVTRKMEIKYVRQVPVGKLLTVRGSISGNSHTAGREKIRVEGRIVDTEGHLLARSAGEFVLLPKEALGEVPEGMKQEMLALFERLEHHGPERELERL